MREETKAFSLPDIALTAKLKALYSSQDSLPKLIEDEQIKALSLDEYYVKLQILLSESDESSKAALRDKVIGEKKPVEIENIFKAIDVENRIRELLERNYRVQEKIVDDIIKPLIEEENKFNLLYRNIPNKSESEIKHIAESITRIQADVGKVLLLGGAGIGKTTLMHYLSYSWGRKDLWNDKFDYVFRIKLKELLNENWSREYEPGELRQSKLACFIHYCLDSKNIKLEEIQSIENKDKVLLLLDGYDEVAFLSQDSRDYRDIMEAVFQYKNVIMTSRPNAITENISGKFERKVENTGWDSEGIEKYVSKSFEHDQDLGVQLKSFLNTHSQIKEICEIPINTALICLIWNDPKIRDEFQKNSKEDFNISLLYSEIINWLNNRYLAKTRHKYKNKTEANNHLKNIMSFLEYIAYESLVATGKLVENKRVESNKDTLDIDEVIEQGLLRREGQNYQFIHLTFQEFLAARHLKNQLLDNHTKNEKANFIGRHRNEPKYLMTLKFLAGIASNDDSQELTEIFWEAATCNVNGILELGIEKKIALLMHLLAQSKIHGQFDNRIPHLKQIQNLIDDIVLKDITIWEQHIIDSGYLSEAIVEVVDDILRNKEATFQEFKTFTEIMAALANRNEWGGKTKVYEKLVGLLKITDTQLQKVILQKLAQILDETIDEQVVQKSLKEIVSLLDIWELKKDVNIILIKVMSTVANFDESILNQIQKLDDNYLVIESLVKIVKSIPKLEPQIIKIFQELLRNYNEDFDFLTGLNLTQIVEAIPSLAAEAIRTFKFLINNSSFSKYDKFEYTYSLESGNLFNSPNNGTIYDITKNLTRILNVIHKQQSFNILKELLNDSNVYIKSGAALSLAKLANTMPDLVHETFNILKELINDHRNEIKSAAAWSLAELINTIPDITPKIFDILKNLLENSEAQVKSAAAWSLVELTNTIPDITPKVFDTLKKLLNNYDDYIQFTVVESLARLVNMTPILAQKVFTILRKLITNPYTNKYVRSKAISSLASIVQIKPNLAQKIFYILLEVVVLKNDVTPEVVTSLGWIVQANPNLAQDGLKLLKLLIHKISDFNNYINFTILRSLGWMVQANPNIGQEASKILIKLSSNPDVDVKTEAILILIEIKKVKHTKELFTELSEIISDSKNDRYVKHIAAQGLAKIANEMSFTKVVAYRNFAELVKITILTENQTLYKNSYPVFRNTLHKITDHITQEYAKRKNPEMIKWFTGCFRELPNINETRVFLKEICKAILKSGAINQLESQFILNCVKYCHFTFTVAVKKDHKEIEGEVIFEDRSYQIFKNSNISIEEFAEILLAATDDPLAEQYKTYKPLFLNKGIGLKVAASDILDVNSITNEKTKLPTETSLLSYVRDAKDNFVILLEKRSVFGDHLIYKINKDNFEKVATIYPAEIDEATIRQIFNVSEYEELYKSVVQSKILGLDEIFEQSGKLKENFLQNIQKLLQDIKPVNLKLPYLNVNTRLDVHETRLDDQDQKLEDSGITQKAEINREVERLKQEHPKLYNYCNIFYWAIKNLVTACCIAETEFFKMNTKKNIISFLKKPFLEFFNSAIKKLLPIAIIADLTTNILEEVIYNCSEKRQVRKHKNNVTIINDIIHHKIGMQDLENYLKKITLTITHARKKEIMNPKETPQSGFLTRKLQELANMILNKAKNIALPEVIKSCDKDNIAVQLALKDSIAFINYLYTNYDDILKDDFDLFEQCKNIVADGTLDALFAKKR